MKFGPKQFSSKPRPSTMNFIYVCILINKYSANRSFVNKLARHNLTAHKIHVKHCCVCVYYNISVKKEDNVSI